MSDDARTSALARWDLPVRDARFVDAARAEALRALGVETVGDLLRHYPFRYLDLRRTPRLSDVRPGEEVTLIGRVHEVKVKKPKPRLTVVEVALVDGTSVVLGVWFNQGFIANRFVVGERVAFSGKVELSFGLKRITNPFVEKLGADDSSAEMARILPVHRAGEGITTNWVRRLVASAVDDHGDVPDFMPAAVIAETGMVSLRGALRQIHFPDSPETLGQARRRLAFDELFVLQMAMALRRHAATEERTGIAHVVDGPVLSKLRETIPFTPTADQTTAIDEILADMASPRPMNRLLLGDVGTGKTLVAAHALCAVADTGRQAAMMAPTEVLAIQYAERVGPLLDGAGCSWTLLTGSTPAKERAAALKAIASGDVTVVFGTHALLEKDVEFARLSLAVVDEQHRFGVSQRLALRRKGASADMLVMTATPIPRSLALTVYGDLAASYLRTRPVGDQGSRIATRVVDKRHRAEAYARMRECVRAGRQAYVICPLVDESEATEARAASSEMGRLSQDVFPDLRLGLLTGRMRSAEKIATMRAFREGALDVLVSTTVVEVGVDVPNATMMIVENAERFGLAQLHQLRGRVGRGEHSGEVLLFADPKTDDGKARMQAIESTEDGFELAEYDMRLRGQGNILGREQHGLPPLKLASLTEDAELLDQARARAVALVSSDPGLIDPSHGPLARELQLRLGEAWKWVSAG